MELRLKLITENPDSLDDFEYIEEQSKLTNQSTLYIAGPMIGCNQKNRNGRYYDFDNTRAEVNRYMTEKVAGGRGLGELNHPTTADVDLGRACHMITELRETDDGYFGKAKVLSTPCGQILRSLISDGVKVGMSTRALGTLREHTDYNIVENMQLVAIDAVFDPSHSKAFVNGILESKTFIIDSDGSYEEIYDKFEKSLGSMPKKAMESYLREQIVNFIKKLN